MASVYSIDFAALKKVNPELVRGSPNFCQHLIIAANRWANAKHKLPGYPNFIEVDDKFEIMTSNASRRRMIWADIPFEELRRQSPDLDLANFSDSNLAAWARAVNRVADRGVFKRGNCAVMTGEVVVFGKPVRGVTGVRGANGFIVNTINDNNDGRFVEIPEEQLAAHEPLFKRGVENAFDVWTRAVYRAVTKGRVQGFVFPNYEIGVNRVHGAYVVS